MRDSNSSWNPDAGASVDPGFDLLAGQVSKTALTRQDLLQALVSWGFLPAEEQEEEEVLRRADEIFDFFVPGRQKYFSRREWTILEDLWRETQQQIHDLARFAARKFDFSSNMLDARPRSTKSCCFPD